MSCKNSDRLRPLDAFINARPLHLHVDSQAMALNRIRQNRSAENFSQKSANHTSATSNCDKEIGVFRTPSAPFDSWYVLQENDDETEQERTEDNNNYGQQNTTSSPASCRRQSYVIDQSLKCRGNDFGVSTEGSGNHNSRRQSTDYHLQKTSQHPSTTSTTTNRGGAAGLQKASFHQASGALGGHHSHGRDYEAVAALVGAANVVVAKSTRMHGQWANSQRLGLTELAGSKTATKRQGKVVVSINVVFLKIGEIDTVKETFSADVFIQARWREPLFDNRTDLVLKDIDWSAYWNPQLYVDNVTGNPVQNVWHTVMFNANKEAYVFERRRIAGTFIENLELEEFPFDTQDVTVTVVSERSVREVVLEEDYSELSTVNVQSFVDEQEWRLYRNVESRCDTVIRIYQGDNCCHSSYSARCHASRRYGFYVWNIMFVLFFISSLAFSTFSIANSKPENRLQVTFILLLTTVTFKFVVNSSLPRISYLTYLDKYILSSMVVMGLIGIWHSVSWKIDSVNADTWALVTLAAFFLLVQCSFIFLICFRAIRQQRVFVEKERVHNERIKQLAHLSTTTSKRLKQTTKLSHVYVNTVADTLGSAADDKSPAQTGGLKSVPTSVETHI